MTAPPLEPDTGRPPVTTGEGLAELLAAQHAELAEAWRRIPTLHAGAREDVFLHARRRLAVHLALEEVLLAPHLQTGDAERAVLEREVLSAEHAGPGAPTFDAACARVAGTLLRHGAAQEAVVMTGTLPEREQEVVSTAVALWDGAGDAYLGNAWAEMRATALEQLAPPA
jgi:hypothetical protein